MNHYDDTDIIITLIFIIFIQILFFIVLREIIMWYWKINKRIELHQKTNSLLEQILASKNLEKLEIYPSKQAEGEKLSLNEIYKKNRQLP